MQVWLLLQLHKASHQRPFYPSHILAEMVSLGLTQSKFHHSPPFIDHGH